MPPWKSQRATGARIVQSVFSYSGFAGGNIRFIASGFGVKSEDRTWFSFMRGHWIATSFYKLGNSPALTKNQQRENLGVNFQRYELIQFLPFGPISVHCHRRDSELAGDLDFCSVD